jgi:hypothetical protein
MAGLIDEAAEMLSDRLGRKLDRSAYYEALLSAGLRRMGEVEEALRADPEGLQSTRQLVRVLEARGWFAAEAEALPFTSVKSPSGP